MPFRSPPPHRHSSGNIGNALTKRGKPAKWMPHIGRKQIMKGLVRTVMTRTHAMIEDQKVDEAYMEALHRYDDEFLAARKDPS